MMDNIKTYKAIALGDCEAKPHSWSVGQEYEVRESPTLITMSSNEGRTHYKPVQKVLLKLYFEFSGRWSR